MHTKQLLEDISKQCSNELTLYKFNKSTLIVSDKYRSGGIDALNYALELIYYFFEQDKLLKRQFHDLLLTQLNDTHMLKDGDHRQGLHDALEGIITQLNNKK